jgi:cytochrome P450
MSDMATAEEVTQLDLEEVDLLDPNLHQDGPPHELFARMRKEAPVRRNTVKVYEQEYTVWSVTRHEDITAISRDTDTWSSSKGGIFVQDNQVLPLDVTRNLLLYKDPPEHTKYRGILKKVFTPRTVANLEDQIRARVTRVIDEVVEAGECDFVQAIAKPIPLGVLTELMGVPDKDIPKFAEWTDQIEEAQRAIQENGALDTLGEMAGYLHQHTQEQADVDGLVKKMHEAEVDGEKLKDEEILVFFALLSFAGNDTTRNTSALGMKALLEHPDQLAQLRENPDLIENAVEEILRYTTVVKWFVRTATQDTTIGDQEIKEGEKVIMWYASGSRDEEVFDDPQTFDVQREKPDHKAFGGGGRHFCLGNAVARLELKIIFEEVLRRMQDIELNGEPEILQSSWAHALTSLPIKFTPGEKAA